MRDVEEDRVVGLARGLDQRVVAAERALHLVHPGEAPQQARQILELGLLVVDRQDRQPLGAHTDPPARAAAPLAAEVGHGHHRRRPLADVGLDPQRVALAERRAQPGVDVGEPDAAAGAGQHGLQRARARSRPRRRRPAARRRRPTVRAEIATRPVPARRSTPWRTAFSTSGCTDMAGTTVPRVCLGNVDRDVQAVAEAGLLQPQVALDVLDLLAERHVRAAVAEQVAGELGEVDQQLARLLGPGVDVARHRGERVVDEVRRDLRPQRAQLGLGDAAPPARRPATARPAPRPGWPPPGRPAARGGSGARPSGRRRSASRPACPGRSAARAPRSAAGRSDRRRPAGARCARWSSSARSSRRESRSPGPDLLAPLAVDRQHRAGVGERDRRGAHQRPQVGDGALGVAGGQALAQVGERAVAACSAACIAASEPPLARARAGLARQPRRSRRAQCQVLRPEPDSMVSSV